MPRRKKAVKRLDALQLSPRLRAALQEARDRIPAEFDVDRMVLFDSVARGTADEESDIDLLIVLKWPPGHKIRNRISRVILAINLKYAANLSGLVVDREAWNEGLLSVLPIHAEIEEEGIPL
jgi:uncharacterized protein